MASGLDSPGRRRRFPRGVEDCSRHQSGHGYLYVVARRRDEQVYRFNGTTGEFIDNLVRRVVETIT